MIQKLSAWLMILFGALMILTSIEFNPEPFVAGGLLGSLTIGITESDPAPEFRIDILKFIVGLIVIVTGSRVVTWLRRTPKP